MFRGLQIQDPQSFAVQLGAPKNLFSLTESDKFIILDMGIISCIYLGLGISILLSKHKFSDVAFDIPLDPPTSLKFKIILMKSLILLNAISAMMAFLIESYWSFHSGFWLGILYFIPIMVLFEHISWMKFQFERNLPLQWYQNQLAWILLSGSHIFTLIICYFFPGSRYVTPDFIIIILKTIVAITLGTFACIIPQDRIDYLATSADLKVLLLSKKLQSEKVSKMTIAALQKNKALQEQLRERSRSRDISKPRQSSENANCPLSVTIINKVQKKEGPQKGDVEFLYKLHVKTDTQDYKILKTLPDFKRLENALFQDESMPLTRSFAGETLNVLFNDRESENLSNVSFIVSALQNFFKNLIVTGKITREVLCFLEIPDTEHQQLLRWSKKMFQNYARSLSDYPYQENQEMLLSQKLASPHLSDDEEEDEEEKKEYFELNEEMGSKEDVDESRDQEKDFYPFFSVKILRYQKVTRGNHYEYVIRLQLIEKPDEIWEVNRRYNDFVTLREQLQSETHVSPPKLPAKFKLIRQTEDQLEKRKVGLENWLQVILNEKVYFTTFLFNFINLNPLYFEWLKEEEIKDLSNFKATIDANQVLISNNKPYTVYHIIIEERRQISDAVKKRYTILRRYKEFYELHKALQLRFSHSQAKLPELPPKYTTFSNKTTVEFRQQHLENFLNSLFSYPNIEDSFAFRKFINYKRPLDSFITLKETSDQIISSSSEFETPNISNAAIEKTLSTAKSKKHN